MGMSKAKRISLCAVLIALALILPATVFYTMWLSGILLFVLAVYYATKLM